MALFLVVAQSAPGQAHRPKPGAGAGVRTSAPSPGNAPGGEKV